MSPILFALYVNDMLVKVNESGYGCVYNFFPFAALMYADDIIIISASVESAQRLIDICIANLNLIDLSVNCIKSNWLRIGKRFDKLCKNVEVGNNPIECTNSLSFLGTTIVSSSKFSIDLVRNKRKFFGNANTIFEKIGTSNFSDTYCISALLYNLEVVELSKSVINSLNFAYHRMFMKIFKTVHMDVVSFRFLILACCLSILS